MSGKSGTTPKGKPLESGLRGKRAMNTLENMKTKPLTIAIIISCLLWSVAVFAQENYIIVSNSSNDSLFCSKHCPFFDFDQNAIINGSTIPDQFVEYQNDSLKILLEEMVWSVESTPCFDNDKECVKLSNLIYSNLKQIDTITQPKTIYVEFLVDTLGYTHDHTVLNPTNSVLDDEALRVCRLVKFDHPAMQRNHPVCMKMYFPVKFKPTPPKKQKQGLFKHQK